MAYPNPSPIDGDLARHLREVDAHEAWLEWAERHYDGDEEAARAALEMEES